MTRFFLAILFVIATACGNLFDVRAALANTSRAGAIRSRAVVRSNCGQHVAVANQQVANQQLVAIPNNFVVTQFAVPVGVPVAQQSYVSYGQASTVGYGGAIQSSIYAAPMSLPATTGVCSCQQGTAHGGCGGGTCAPPTPQPTPIPQPAPSPAPPPTPQPPAEPLPAISLLQQNCAICHTGDAAKGNFRVDLQLTCEQKLKAIGALLDDRADHRMPKGVQLDPQTLGKLIQELSK